MERVHLKITPFRQQGKKLIRDSGRQIEVLFNPNSYSITKSVTWSPPDAGNGKVITTQRGLDAPTLTFGGGGSRRLTLELLFDTTEPSDPVGEFMTDVRRVTDKLVALTRIERDQGQPPVCEVAWGAPSKDFPFVGVISDLTQRFTLFTSDGTPVRATLTVVLVEFLDPELDKRETDPELTTRVVKRGDTLSSIAGDVYHDPAQWRVIAEANQIDDPRALPPGRRLIIPRVS